jgi:hypothetical protein
MPATLRAIKGQVIDLAIYLGPAEKPEIERTEDDYINISYRVHSLTGLDERVAKLTADQGRELEALADTCLPVFVKWDLKPGATDEQVARQEELEARLMALGTSEDRKSLQKELTALNNEIKATVDAQEVIPITKDGLMTVPSSVLFLILNAIQESRRPNETGTGPQ